MGKEFSKEEEGEWCYEEEEEEYEEEENEEEEINVKNRKVSFRSCRVC